MAGRKKTETVEAEVVETAVVPAGKMEFRLINPTEDGFLRRIQWNKEELEAAVRAKIAGYENVVYTEENIKAAKNDRAELNKLIKAIEERRKRLSRLPTMKISEIWPRYCRLKRFSTAITLIRHISWQPHRRKSWTRSTRLRRIWRLSTAWIVSIS
jgi:hypothetical protein